MYLVPRRAELGDEFLACCEHFLVDGLGIGQTVVEGVCLGVFDDDGRRRRRMLRGEKEERCEEGECGEEGVSWVPLEDGRHDDGDEKNDGDSEDDDGEEREETMMVVGGKDG